MSRGVETENNGTNVQNGGRGRRNVQAKCAGEMCRRNLGFQPSKKTTKGQFLIFFHGKVLLYTYSLKTVCNFHMTT